MALITAQLISLVFGKKYFPADFAFPEIQPPIVQAVQIIDYQRIQGRISSNTLHFPFAVWIPEVKPGIFLWQRTMNIRENIQSFGLPVSSSKSRGGLPINKAVKPFIFFNKTFADRFPISWFSCLQIFIPDTKCHIHSHRITGEIFFLSENHRTPVPVRAVSNDWRAGLLSVVLNQGDSIRRPNHAQRLKA